MTLERLYYLTAIGAALATILGVVVGLLRGAGL
jgi:hypothetical protein